MAIHIRVYGRVQGVGFRAWTLDKALSFNLKGFVRNRRDGSVEIWADGEESQLAEFVAACHQGPVFANVKQLTPMQWPDAPMPEISDTFTLEHTV